MNYISLAGKSNPVSFREAVVKGIAPDKGLYFPEGIASFPIGFIDSISSEHQVTIAYEAIKQFVGDEIPIINLLQIIQDTLCFDFPLVKISENISSL